MWSPSLVAYLLYHFRMAGPNPGHTWVGLFRNLTLTQIYTDDYMYSYLHQGLTQMWSLAVEVAFYVALAVHGIPAAGAAVPTPLAAGASAGRAGRAGAGVARRG